MDDNDQAKAAATLAQLRQFWDAPVPAAGVAAAAAGAASPAAPVCTQKLFF